MLTPLGEINNQVDFAELRLLCIVKLKIYEYLRSGNSKKSYSGLTGG